jgi:hypothetical protein
VVVAIEAAVAGTCAGTTAVVAAGITVFDTVALFVWPETGVVVAPLVDVGELSPQAASNRVNVKIISQAGKSFLINCLLNSCFLELSRNVIL